jgi:UDP-N-acetyl-D-mannosaminuronate dehydrogenase
VFFEGELVTGNDKVLVVGLGEVGKPLFELLSRAYDVVGIDIEPVQPVSAVRVLHICYPFEIRDFIAETANYIEHYQPELTIINSTVAIGTTRAIADRTGAAVVNSPVRGKHARMLQDLEHYVKFVGASDFATGQRVVKHFEAAGLKTKLLSSPEATELAKLAETTFFGVLIAWAQEVERYCDQVGAEYNDVISFYDEITFFPPVKYSPGIIGGHCVMPNIKILKHHFRSAVLDAIESSNQTKIEREAGKEVGARAVSASD